MAYCIGKAIKQTGALNLGSHGSAIGYKLSSNGEYFNGEIKSVRIYNRKLNAE